MPFPLSIIPLIITRKWVAGTSWDMNLRTGGIDAMGKIKPESMTDGNNVAIRAIIIATCWVDARVEIKRPSEREVNK